MTKGPYIIFGLLAAILLLIQVSPGSAQVFPAYNFASIYNQIQANYPSSPYNYYPATNYYPTTNYYSTTTSYYPLANNLRSGDYSPYFTNTYTTPPLQNIYSYPRPALPNRGFSDSYYAAANRYLASAFTNAVGTWVGTWVRTYTSRIKNDGGSMGGNWQANSNTINLNLAQYENFVSGIAALTEGNSTAIINVNGDLSDNNQLSLIGTLPAGLYPESYQFKANATIQGDSIRGIYTVTDTVRLATIEVGSINVTRQVLTDL